MGSVRKYINISIASFKTFTVGNLASCLHEHYLCVYTTTRKYLLFFNLGVKNICGLVGYFNFAGEPGSSHLIRQMADQLSHRGPDDEGTFVEGNLALGFRRLSIVDLSDAAHQPMQDRSGRYVLLYNGEIYNYEALRLELSVKGYRFQSSSDTEVLLNALVEWGTDAISRFNGMFAIALYDSIEKTILLARDRYGTKPLYTAVQNNCFFFGSEAKSFSRTLLFLNNWKKKL